ncbi:PIN domain-containing protein [Candidatus Woesearchaeota archaeon]|nr:PIN domain-containing protein [Candidatus Woesearchaeota archaeon]
MKQLFDQLPKLMLTSTNLVLVDTSFFIYTFEKHHEKQFLQAIKKNHLALTSFNVEEFLFVHHKLNDHLVERVRHFLQSKPQLYYLSVPVKPGYKMLEKQYMNSIDPYMARHIKDWSDGVLLATAIKTHSAILTRDKHHLFTVELENWVKKYGIQIYNNLKDII